MARKFTKLNKAATTRLEKGWHYHGARDHLPACGQRRWRVLRQHHGGRPAHPPRRRVMYVPRAKAGAREQPITEALAGFLRSYIASLPDGCEWLFPSSRSASGHTTNIEERFRRVVGAAGLDPKTVVRHTLRHTAITHLVHAGVDLPTVKRISGHKTLVMVERYAHANGAHIQAAMDRLDERYRTAKAA